MPYKQHPTKKKKTDGSLLGKIFRKIAPKIGATIVMEPEWNIVGQIIFKNGRKRYIRYSTLDLNPVGASDIAEDKDYANFFMERMGYPTVPGRTFFSNDWGRVIHPDFKKIAIRLTRDMGLRFCGVDLMTQGGISKKPDRYWILEVNAAPGLDHYVKTGKAQEKIVEDMYLTVLKAMQ